jgi:hypothetical protein
MHVTMPDQAENMAHDFAVVGMLVQSAPKMQEALTLIEKSASGAKGCDASVLEDVVNNVQKIALRFIHKNRPTPGADSAEPVPAPSAPTRVLGPTAIAHVEETPLEKLLEDVQVMVSEQRKYGGCDVEQVCESFSAYKLSQSNKAEVPDTLGAAAPVAEAFDVPTVRITLDVNCELTGGDIEAVAEILESSIRNEIDNNRNLLSLDDVDGASNTGYRLTSSSYMPPVSTRLKQRP